MPQVCVDGPVPGVPANVWEKGCKLNAFNALLDAHEFRDLLITERVLIPLRYMVFVDAGYMRHDGNSGCGSAVIFPWNALRISQNGGWRARLGGATGSP